ncbi:MAG: alpha/beta hydrolase family protein [Aeromicrobium sp.]
MRIRIVSLLVILGAALATAPAHADPISGQGLTVTATNVIDTRQTEYTVTTSALEKPVHIRVVMPTGYDPSSARRYPVLYLYHGTSGRPSDWINAGDALNSTAGRDVILVLPEAGYDGDGGGWFVNWWNKGAGGKPMWETFEVGQVIPWIDANFPTIPDRDHRAIAGLSQGGFGAMHAAARHPDMFTSVATFSGAPEIYRNPAVRAGADAIIEAVTVGLDNKPAFSVLGDPVTNGVHWQGHDPGTLVTNLADMDIAMWVADGVPGTRDIPANEYSVSANLIEGGVSLSSHAFHQHLAQAKIPHFFKDYVFGTHNFPYWAQDLREYLPGLMTRFAHPSTPGVVSYRSIEKTFSQWGWDVSVSRQKAEAMTELKAAGQNGFQLRGANAAIVTTPAFYPPNTDRTVKVSSGGKTTTSIIKTDGDGRLTASIFLGNRGLVTTSIVSIIP